LVVTALGLLAALVGIARSLASVHPPMRYPFFVLDVWRVLFRKPESIAPAAAATRLPKAVMLLRSFPADTASVEMVDQESRFRSVCVRHASV
jgi:hypothetical protein